MSTRKTALAATDGAPPLDAAIVERLVIGGDLSALTPAQRLAYYHHRCRAIGLDPAARPFQYLALSGRLSLYATKGCAQQLGARDKLTFSITSARVEGDLFVVVGRVADPFGRSTDDIGAVAVAGLRGDALANAAMKARTKTHRRCVLSHCGLGELDESEVGSIPGARTVAVETAHAEVSIAPPAARDAADRPPAPAPDESPTIEAARTASMRAAFARMKGWSPERAKQFCCDVTGRASRRDCTLADWQSVHEALDELDARAATPPDQDEEEAP